MPLVEGPVIKFSPIQFKFRTSLCTLSSTIIRLKQVPCCLTISHILYDRHLHCIYRISELYLLGLYDHNCSRHNPIVHHHFKLQNPFTELHIFSLNGCRKGQELCNKGILSFATSTRSDTINKIRVYKATYNF
jgi:hypothetical protein